MLDKISIYNNVMMIKNPLSKISQNITIAKYKGFRRFDYGSYVLSLFSVLSLINMFLNKQQINFFGPKPLIRHKFEQS